MRATLAMLSAIVVVAVVAVGLTAWKSSGTSKVAREDERKGSPRLYEFTVKDIDGKDVTLSTFKGKVLMLVNVASKCGNTPQYEQLQSLYEKYKDRGFEILAFPANNFLGQEPGTDEQIKEFCTTNYHVTFNLFSKISVSGEDIHPLYKYITEESSVPGKVTWNFQKYLVDRDGNIVAKYAPRTKPDVKEVVDAIERLLASRN